MGSPSPVQVHSVYAVQLCGAVILTHNKVGSNERPPNRVFFECCLHSQQKRELSTLYIYIYIKIAQELPLSMNCRSVHQSGDILYFCQEVSKKKREGGGGWKDLLTFLFFITSSSEEGFQIPIKTPIKREPWTRRRRGTRRTRYALQSCKKVAGSSRRELSFHD